MNNGEIIKQTREYERGTWRQALRERYPSWLRYEDLPWGFRVHDGWQGLIEAALHEVSEIVGGPEGAPDLRIIEVKEKFGQLRIYVNYGDMPEAQREAVHAILREAEERSADVCEVCGAPGKLVRSGAWWHTACPKHENPKRD